MANIWKTVLYAIMTDSSFDLTRSFLEQLQALGMETLYVGTECLENPALLSKQERLDEFSRSLQGCTLCKLCSGRTQVVFGVGNPDADLVFVGEGPGFDEDRQGIPFVGKAGQLLTKMIENGMGLRRSDVYICNVVKCRPPGNRNPAPDEIALCEPFLFKQLDILQPRVIVALGKFAAQTLLQSTAPISQLRGKWYTYRGIKLLPTFHPAYLLRNPADKNKAWEDLKKVMTELGLPVPK